MLAGPDAAQLVLISSDSRQLTLRVKDVNDLPYPGVRVQASGVTATSNSSGQVSFNWTAGQTLSARIEGASGASVFVNPPSPPPFSFTGPVNAASGEPGLAPGGIATIFGANLAGAQVLLDGNPASVLLVSETQVDFLVPAEQSLGSTRLTVVAAGVSIDLPTPAAVTLVSPGIFFDAATGYGKILNAGTTETTLEQPAARGDSVEIYATGLGPAGLVPEVTIGGVPAMVGYSGLAPGYPGLYQVNAQIPMETLPGEQPLSLTINGVRSNVVKIGVR